MPEVLDYLGLIPPMNAGKPDFIATLGAVLQPLCDIQAQIANITTAFDLDVAIGAQLDVDGIWIGRSRFINTPIAGVYFSWDVEGLGWEQGYWQGAFDPDTGVSVLDDETYRKLLYAKAAANEGDCSLPSTIDVLGKLLDGEGVSATVFDNQDMSMRVEVHGSLQNLILRSIIVGGYVPIKPAGVTMTFLIADPLQFPVSATITGLGGVQARFGLVQFGAATIHGAAGVVITDPAILVGTIPPILGHGVVVARAIARSLGSAGFAGLGTVQGIANRQQPIAATIAGLGAIQGDANLPQPALLTLLGAGSLQASVRARLLGSSELDGSGLAQVVGTNTRMALSGTVMGMGAVLAFAVRNQTGSGATLVGAGSVSGNASVVQPGSSATIAGHGLITAPARWLASATMTRAGSGSLAAPAVLRGAARATIAGAGGVSATAASLFWGATNFYNQISNGGLRVTKIAGNHASYTSTKTNKFYTSGKKYWEINITNLGDSINSDVMVGLARYNFDVTNTDLNGYLGALAVDDSWGWFRYGTISGSGGEVHGSEFINQGDVATFTTGSRCSVALDIDNLKWWVRVDGGFWNAGSGGTQDPATNQGGLVIPSGMVSGGIGPGITLYIEGDQIDACFTPASWNYAAPSGFGQVL